MHKPNNECSNDSEMILIVDFKVEIHMENHLSKCNYSFPTLKSYILIRITSNLLIEAKFNHFSKFIYSLALEIFSRLNYDIRALFRNVAIFP